MFFISRPIVMKSRYGSDSAILNISEGKIQSLFFDFDDFISYFIGIVDII